MRPFLRNKSGWLCSLAVVAFVSSPLAADFDERLTFEAKSLFVGNLIGEIHIEGHSGDAFEVEIRARGKDASRDSLKLESREGREARLVVVFPVDREERFVYPHLKGSRTTLNVPEDQARSRSWLGELLHAITQDRIRISSRGSGVEMWADLKIKVPAGSSLEVRHGVGEIRGEAIEGDLRVDVSRGGVEIETVEGNVNIDTGSGKVALEAVTGEVRVDTGSGSVNLARCDSSQVLVDTGSGGVEVSEIHTERLQIDTGSGSVRARGIRTEGAVIDTGSGSVELELLEMGDGRFDIDTGSGSITLLLPSSASAQINADTGSGGVHVDVDSADTLSQSRNEAVFRVGRGDAKVRLDAGSGAIRVGPSRGR